MTDSWPGAIFQPGDLLNNTYRIEEILGRGGTSEVYKARSEISGRVMAVKALRAEFASNEDFLSLMTREEDIREIRHDAIVRYFDTQRMPDGVVYLVMEHVDGPGLDAKLKAGGMPAGDLMIVGRRVCEGLIAAHARNIVHRDLSPDNIILRHDDPAEAVIIDFGIAKDTNPGAETIVGNEFAGKYAYAAPEQLSGNTDARSDLYALGALLLATFRGRKPDVGANPMEVVQRKGEPLDLTGVPDPLGRLIARMCAPDPADRFQTAAELLAAFDDPGVVPSAGDAELDDRTVIRPVAARPTTSDPAMSGIPPAPKAAPTPTPRKRGVLVPVLGVAVLLAVGAGLFATGTLDGLTGPDYPVADPYALVIDKPEDGAPRATGNVPSPEVETALQDRLAAQDGSAELTLASGDIGAGWGDGVLRMVEEAAPLSEYRIAVSGDRVSVTGLAPTRGDLEAVRTAFAQGLPEGFEGSSDFALGPRFVTPEALDPVLAQVADCGPLDLQAPPPLGYGLEDQILVTGRFAQEATRDRLTSALADVAGDRPVRVEGEVLNAALCRIDAALPRARAGGFDLRFGYGDRAEANPSRTYRVGDNPVIDVRLPDDIDGGYLYVSVVDVEGVVFHLLPNRTRPDNGIETLRGEADDGWIRVAYSVADATANGRLAFNVDDSVLGKSKVIVLYATEKLFDELRPITESAASYAEALEAAMAAGDLQVQSIDSALVTTVR